MHLSAGLALRRIAQMRCGQRDWQACLAQYPAFPLRDPGIVGDKILAGAGGDAEYAEGAEERVETVFPARIGAETGFDGRGGGRVGRYVQAGHGGLERGRLGGAVGLAALAACGDEAELAQGFGRVGFGDGDGAGAEQGGEVALERP